ncbi:hypothetical protein ACFOWB_03375 [Chenggangzhangella methanolivorans]
MTPSVWQALALLACAALAACGEASPWTALVVAPRKDVAGQPESVGLFRSLEDCRAAAVAKLAERGWSGDGSYHCGYRCEPHRDAFVCESMQR